MKTTWKKELDVVLAKNGETWEDVEANTLSEAEMETEFNSGYGRTEGARHPNGKPTEHQGGGKAI